MTQAISGRAFVGCSGWDYRSLAGAGVPARTFHAASWFDHYAGLFDTVELNTTFYRLPETDTVERWAQQAPPGFTYAAKLGRFGSHRMKLKRRAALAPQPPRPPRPAGRPRRPDARAAPTSVAAQRRAPRRVPHRGRTGEAVGGGAAGPVVVPRRRVRLPRTPRRRPVPPRPAARSPVAAHHGLDLSPLPRACCTRRPLRGPVRPGPPEAHRGAPRRDPRRWRRRVRLLQQRLGRGRGRRCHLAARPPGAAAPGPGGRTGVSPGRR